MVSSSSLNEAPIPASPKQGPLSSTTAVRPIPLSNNQIALKAIVEAAEAQKMFIGTTAIFVFSSFNFLFSLIPSYRLLTFSNPEDACRFAQEHGDVDIYHNEDGGARIFYENSTRMSAPLHVEIASTVALVYSATHWFWSVKTANTALRNLPPEEKSTLLAQYRNLFFVE